MAKTKDQPDGVQEEKNELVPAKVTSAPGLEVPALIRELAGVLGAQRGLKSVIVERESIQKGVWICSDGKGGLFKVYP